MSCSEEICTNEFSDVFDNTNSISDKIYKWERPVVFLYYLYLTIDSANLSVLCCQVSRVSISFFFLQQIQSRKI